VEGYHLNKKTYYDRRESLLCNPYPGGGLKLAAISARGDQKKKVGGVFSLGGSRPFIKGANDQNKRQNCTLHNIGGGKTAWGGH